MPEIPRKKLIVRPVVFAQDIPQEAETTGNVCPASSLFHAYMHTCLHIHIEDGTYVTRGRTMQTSHCCEYRWTANGGWASQFSPRRS